jgi:hypothetical protein
MRSVEPHRKRTPERLFSTAHVKGTQLGRLDLNLS